MEGFSNLCGKVAAVLFIIANVYFPAKQIARRFTVWTKETADFFRVYLVLHGVLNTIAFCALILHGHYAEEHNYVLQASFILTVFLILQGLIMQYKLAPGVQRQMRILHTQQALFFVWVALIIIGHAIA